MSRNTELLESAAYSLDDGIDPFTSDWLRTHNVTLDECYTLGETMALAIRCYLQIHAELHLDNPLARRLAAEQIVGAIIKQMKSEAGSK